MPIHSSLRPQPREIVMASTPPDVGQPTREARTGREDRGQRGNKWWTLGAVCLGTFMLLLDITIVTVALPDIQRALHSSFADLQWVVDAYALTLAAFLLTAGSLADMYGLRALLGGAVEPGLRADRVEPAVLHRRPGARLLRRGGGAARRLRHRGAAQRAPDVRPEPVPAAGLQRRLGRGVRAQCLDLRDDSLPGAVPAGHLGLFAAPRK